MATDKALQKTNGTEIAPPADPFMGLHPIVRRMLENNPSPETLRELLAVQKEWDAENARRSFNADLAALKADLPTTVGKDKTVDFTGRSGIRTFYKHTSLAAIMDAVTAPLARHGFSLSWEPSSDKNEVTVICRLAHTAGHSMTAKLAAQIDDSGNKSRAQGVASTITLLSRYTAMSLLGLASADMDEPTGPDTPGAETRGSGRATSSQRSPEQQAASQLLDEVLAAMAGAKSKADLDKACEPLSSNQIPEGMKQIARGAYVKHSQRLGLKNGKPAEARG